MKKLKLTVLQSSSCGTEMCWLRVCAYEGSSPGTLSCRFCIKTWMINHLCFGSLWQGRSRVHCGEVCWCHYWRCAPWNMAGVDKEDMLSQPSSDVNNRLYSRTMHGNPSDLICKVKQWTDQRHIFLSACPGHQICVLKYSVCARDWFYFNKGSSCKGFLLYIF